MIIPLGKKPFEMNMSYFILFGWFYKSDFLIHHISQKAPVSQVKVIRFFSKSSCSCAQSKPMQSALYIIVVLLNHSPHFSAN